MLCILADVRIISGISDRRVEASGLRRWAIFGEARHAGLTAQPQSVCGHTGAVMRRSSPFF